MRPYLKIKKKEKKERIEGGGQWERGKKKETLYIRHGQSAERNQLPSKNTFPANLFLRTEENKIWTCPTRHPTGSFQVEMKGDDL